jgi:hypothetical protein
LTAARTKVHFGTLLIVDAELVVVTRVVGEAVDSLAVEDEDIDVAEEPILERGMRQVSIAASEPKASLDCRRFLIPGKLA